MVPGCQEGCYKWSGWFCSQGVLEASEEWHGTPSCLEAGFPSWLRRWSCRWGTAGCRPCCRCCTWRQGTGGGTGDHTVPGGLQTRHGRCHRRQVLCSLMALPEPPCRWCSPTERKTTHDIFMFTLRNNHKNEFHCEVFKQDMGVKSW